MSASTPSLQVKRRGSGLNRTAILALIFAVEMILLGAFVPGYLDAYSLLDVSRIFVETGLIALGMTLVIITGGIDLSAGGLLALVSVVVGFSFQAGLPMPAAMLMGVLCGVSCGLFNGAIIAYLRLHPLVVTLATMALFRGLAFALSGAGYVSSFPDWFTQIGSYFIGGFVPVQLPIFIGLGLLFYFLLSRTTLGRRIYAIGANERAVHFSGVNVTQVKLIVYGLMGLLVSLAAIIQTSRLSTARANLGIGMEMPVIAAVVLGGTSILGGSGSMAGTIIGVMMLFYLQDGLEFAGISSDIGMSIIGSILIIGVMINNRVYKAGNK
jgi:rhamnose transport system permease protein